MGAGDGAVRSERLGRALALGGAVLLGAWMLFDGARALVVGDYVTPTTGRYAGQLGPWADVLAAAGIAPRAPETMAAFVVLGVAWLSAALAHASRARHAGLALATLAVLSLWYLPSGTLLAGLVLAGLALARRASRGRARGEAPR